MINYVYVRRQLADDLKETFVGAVIDPMPCSSLNNNNNTHTHTHTHTLTFLLHEHDQLLLVVIWLICTHLKNYVCSILGFCNIFEVI